MTTDLSVRISSHMVAAVKAAPAEREPFPHAIFPNFFPADVYDDLLEFLPKNDQYESFAYEKHHANDGSSNRLRFRMHNEWLDRLSGSQRTFWYAVRQALGSQTLKEAIYDKMRVGLAFRFGVPEGQVNSIRGYALPEMFRELASYRIKPHPDTRRKVVTMQISLPPDASQRSLGTEFYKRSVNPLNMLREPRGFEIVKTTPYVPNSAYCFAVLNNVTWKSWHGRSTLPSQCGVRNSILNIWYQNAEDANLDITTPVRKAA
jgi:hypothetical protein